MASKQQKQLSRSSNLLSEPAEEEHRDERQETRSNNGSHGHQRWQQPDLVSPRQSPPPPRRVLEQSQAPPSAIMEALRRTELPVFGNEVERSEQVSVMEECGRTNQGNSQSSAKSNLPQEAPPVQNRSDFHRVEEMKREELLRPIFFNVMVAGASGVGKTSFIDAFLHRKFKQIPVFREPTAVITEHRGTRQEGSVTFEIGMIDTPGYKTGGHQHYCRLLRKEITSRLDRHEQAERKASQRINILRGAGVVKDERIHCCLYFFLGPRLTEEDCYLMRKLHRVVSIIPVLAHGDSYTKQEIAVIKSNVHEQRYQQSLQWFECQEVLRGHHSSKLSELLNGPFGAAPPFVMVSSFTRIKFEGQKSIYGRQYSWGICNIDNPEHSDFTLLYNLLLVYFRNTLIELTNTCQEEYVRSKTKPRSQEASHLGLFGICVLAVVAIAYRLKHSQ